MTQAPPFSTAPAHNSVLAGVAQAGCVCRVKPPASPAAGGKGAPARGVVKLVLCFLGATLSLAAQADQPLWELGLGVGGLRLPHYRGSDQSHDLLLPTPYAVYRGKIFRATREGARAVLLDSDRFDLDVSVRASAPTRSADNAARSGMADLAPTLELGPNLNSTLARGATWKLDLRLPVHAVFTLQRQSRSLGWTATPVLNFDLRWQGWSLGAQAGPIWATRPYHAYFYDVSAADATTSRAAYGARGGFSGWRWTAGASRRLGPLWVGGFVRGDSVAGAAFEASPLVRQREQVSLGLAMSWVFAVSNERVAVDD